MPVSAYSTNQQVFEHMLVVGIGQALSDQDIENARARGASFKNPDEVKYVNDIPVGVKLIAVYAPSVNNDQVVRRRIQQLAERVHAFCVFLDSPNSIQQIINERLRSVDHTRALARASKSVDPDDLGKSGEDDSPQMEKEFDGTDPFSYIASVIPDGYEYNVRFVAKDVREKMVRGRLFLNLSYAQIAAFVGKIKLERLKQWRADHPDELDLVRQKRSQRVQATKKSKKEAKKALAAAIILPPLEESVSKFVLDNPTMVYRYSDVSKLMAYLRALGHQVLDRRLVGSLMDKALAARDNTLDEQDSSKDEQDEHEEGDYLD